MFDFGAPVGFRLAERHPEWIAGLIIQNGNAYLEGLSDAARDFVALRPEVEGAEDTIRELLTLRGTGGQYESGTRDPALIAPDSWTLDQHFLDLPGRKEAQVALAFDYQSNLQRYDGWQAWLRRHTPPTLITWGRNDPFFPEPGARAYLRDLPDAELHLLDTGHFALEENLPAIAPTHCRLPRPHLGLTPGRAKTLTGPSHGRHDLADVLQVPAARLGRAGRVVGEAIFQVGSDRQVVPLDDLAA